MTPLLFVGLSLACFRVWRLLGRDDITGGLRLRFLKGWALKGTTCPWCLSVYLSAATVFVVDRWFQPVALPVVWTAAMSAVVGFLGEIDAKLGGD